jgi:hypothetical protein
VPVDSRGTAQVDVAGLARANGTAKARFASSAACACRERRHRAEWMLAIAGFEARLDGLRAHHTQWAGNPSPFSVAAGGSRSG